MSWLKRFSSTPLGVDVMNGSVALAKVSMKTRSGTREHRPHHFLHEDPVQADRDSRHDDHLVDPGNIRIR